MDKGVGGVDPKLEEIIKEAGRLLKEGKNSSPDRSDGDAGY
jgi:hypothetical protein